MAFYKKLVEISARKARYRKLKAEISLMSDAELNDLNLSYVQISELARRQP